MMPRSPNNHKETCVKRVVALAGEWITIPESHDIVKIPEGHCWVEGDHSASSLDSRCFGPVSLLHINESNRTEPLMNVLKKRELNCWHFLVCNADSNGVDSR